MHEELAPQAATAEPPTERGRAPVRDPGPSALAGHRKSLLLRPTIPASLGSCSLRPPQRSESASTSDSSPREPIVARARQPRDEAFSDGLLDFAEASSEALTTRVEANWSLPIEPVQPVPGGEVSRIGFGDEDVPTWVHSGPRRKRAGASLRSMSRNGTMYVKTLSPLQLHDRVDVELRIGTRARAKFDGHVVRRAEAAGMSIALELTSVRRGVFDEFFDAGDSESHRAVVIRRPGEGVWAGRRAAFVAGGCAVSLCLLGVAIAVGWIVDLG